MAPPADLAHGAFSDTPPWVLTPEDLDRLAAVDHLRLAEARRVPRLLAPRRTPPGARVARVVREIGGAVVVWKLREGRTDGSRRRAGISRRLRVAAERLGPTYIKLGQIIAAGEGVFPEELVAEFRRCRDQVPAEPFEVMCEVIEAELGRSISDVFSHLEPTPVAAASIAQVHRGRLREGPDGEPVEVVVKVQRPSVGRLVHHDLEVMAWLAPFLIGRIPVTALANPPALVEVFTRTIVEELDFRIEAANMVDIARSLAELGQRHFVVPRPHPHLVTPKVLVMERLSGFPFDAVADQQAAGVDTHEVVRSHMVGLLEGAMIEGVFHGDLHGGNMFVRPDGRTALLDFGMVGRLDDERRIAFLRLLVASTTNDLRGQVAAIRDLGALPPDTDLDEVIAELGLDRPPLDPTALSREELVAELNRVVRALLDFGARMPRELMLFAKNMVFLDSAIARLAPDLDLFAELMQITTYFARTHGARIAAEVGMRPEDYRVDLSAAKASFGVDPALDTLTYRELRARRELIRSRLSSSRR